MSADVLREAAALMRELAAHANSDHKGLWRHGPMLDPENNGHFVANGSPEDDWDTTVAHLPYDFVGATAEHIASWHPAVALEIAAFLDFAAAYGDQPAPQSPTVQFALSIANAYLGRSE